MEEGAAVTEISEDMERTMAESREVTEQYRSGQKAQLQLGQMFLRLFAELLGLIYIEE